MIAWWSIQFTSGRSGAGYMKMSNGICLGVFLEDGTEVLPEESVEYVCTQTENVTPPSWA